MYLIRYLLVLLCRQGMEILICKNSNSFFSYWSRNRNIPINLLNIINVQKIYGLLNKPVLVKKEVRKLPSLKKDIIFTKRFKKVLDHFISKYDIPDFVKIHLK